jgi:hypothetical protein
VPIFYVAIDDILITHEDLSRVENGEVGNWESETDVAQKTTATVGDKTIRNEHKTEITNLSVATVEQSTPENHNTITSIADQTHGPAQWKSKIDSNTRKDVGLQDKVASKPMDRVTDGRSARKAGTAARNAKWQRKCDEILEKNPTMKARSIARKISQLGIANGKSEETIRRNIKLPKKLVRN